jgi:hypothetical protein
VLTLFRKPWRYVVVTEITYRTPDAAAALAFIHKHASPDMQVSLRVLGSKEGESAWFGDEDAAAFLEAEAATPAPE